ncbi:MAG: aminotransferase class I/II-fold pyridoxal phosphate-dependent enzyme [Ruminococcaceae bacterium]|nr:aminotransferase class I/II-fold pyridoxal phosphate-dependent enzyme [Oscillospiraceae bacterium]
MNYQSMTKEEKKSLYESLLSEYNEYKSKGLRLDLSRGKPNSDQLDISLPLLSEARPREKCFSINGIDCRNYGVLDGIPEMKKLFAEMLGLKEEYIAVGGNSSLQLMYDTLTRAMLFGVLGSPRPWCREEGIKWICVAPGYDRHFKMTEVMGFELLTVKMTPTGPDMDEVEKLVKDPKVKGMWCVPKYSNPTGNTYSDETVRRLAKMECAAPDFRIIWDNAYAVHDLGEEGDELLDIFAEAEKHGNLDRIFYFSSTSKITFPGGGVALMAASPANLKQISQFLSVQTIGYDKLNQLRHTAYFKDAAAVHEHMMILAKFIGKKFDITLKNLDALEGLGIAEWTKPKGGYFVSLDVMPGTAKRVYSLMQDAGVTLTGVGATFPYGVDPEDKNLRIAPTYPTDEEVDLATKILVVAVKLAALEKLIEG